MRPEEAKVVAEFLLSTIEREVPVTGGVLAAVPADRLDYRPDSLAKTALGLVRHVTLEDIWFLNCIAAGGFDAFPDDSDACGLMTPPDAVSHYQPGMAAAIGRVRALSGEQLLEEIDFFGAFRLPRIQFLSLMMRHSTHHRGQLSTYLRPMGGKVPPIYGPSADTQQASA